MIPTIDAPRVSKECTACRVCGSSNLLPLFSLGTQFVSDFVSADRVHSGVRCPIELLLCQDCTLVQQRWTAPQDFLYTRHYWYHSGQNETSRQSLRDVAAAAEQLVDLNPGDVVLDIGSNDGTLLRSYTSTGMNPQLVKVGVEPAVNLATEKNYQGLVLINDFWSWNTYMLAAPGIRSEGRVGSIPKAKVITALGMFYDLDDPNAFIADVVRVLAPDGVFIAQLMCLKQMLEQGDIGNLTHEHLLFFSYRSLRRLLENHGLSIFEVEENSVNGGSYRIFARKVETWRLNSPSTLAAERTEDAMELAHASTHHSWFAQAVANRDRCTNFLQAELFRGKRYWVFGASTKGNVILQWYLLDKDCIEAAADRSPEKVGKFTIGTGIPIRSEEDFRKANPECALVLPYAFLPEFIERERVWLEGGGKFIVPLPKARLVFLRNGEVVEEML